VRDRAAAEKLYASRDRMWQAGSATITALLVAPRLAHAAFAEGGIVGDARVAWATKNLERITQLEAFGKLRVEKGVAGPDELAEIATARAEAEFWVEEARQSR
jgi:hypothetical protein